MPPNNHDDPTVPAPVPDPDETRSRPPTDGTATYGPTDFPFLAAPEQPGEVGRLGRFQILSVLGSGGMGVVFRAYDTRLEREVALKAVHARRDGAVAQELFRREARAQAQVEHDNIVPIYDVIQDDDLSYIAMPLLKGTTLPARRAAVEFVLRVGREVAAGLAAAHARGLVHRDVKPTNIWVDDTGRCRLLDFGIARSVAAPEPPAGAAADAGTRTGAFVGTPQYASPEQVRGETTDARTDLFSLGVVLYQLCTGVSPFKGATVADTLERVQSHAPPPPAGVPRELAALIGRMTAKDPADRPASADAVAAELARIAEPRAARWRWTQGTRVLAVVLTVAVLVLLKITATQWSRIDNIFRGLQADMPPPSPAAPPKPVAPPRESAVPFEYVVNGEKKRGTCRIVTVSVGTPPVPLELVFIPKGSFRMGSPGDEPHHDVPEGPRRRVEITTGFYLGRYEVTQEQYAAVMGGNPSAFKGGRLPVEQVSWNSAKVFCDRVARQTGRRADLPTEAEWEFACRAGTETPFSFGSRLTGDLANCDGRQPYPDAAPAGEAKDGTVPVGSYPANPWGLHDMHGNVYEWCRDLYAAYRPGDATDPFVNDNPRNLYRVRRGGSWSEPAKKVRSAYRIWWAADNVDGGNQNGFRVALYPD